MDRRAGDRLVEQLEVLSLAEDDVGGVFDLHQRPMIGRTEVSQHGAAAMRQAIEEVMELAHVDLVGQRLCGREIVDLDESVVDEGVFDVAP